MKPAYILFILSLSLHAIVITTIPEIRVASDSQEYLALANSLSEEGAYRYNDYAETFRTPGYPSFLFLVRACLGEQNNLAVAFLQAVFAGVTAVCIFCLTQKLFTNTAAWLAAILYIFNPGAWNSTTSILTETLFAFLLTLSLTMLLFNDPVKKGFSSFFLGLSCLARPAGLWLFVPIGFILGFYQKGKKERVVFLLVFAAGIALTQGSWLARNYGHYGEWYFTEIKSYYLYAYVATQVKAMRSGQDADVLTHNAIKEYASARKKYSPPELNRIYTQKAWEIIDGDGHYLI
ncbi:hypothetical protein GF373_01795, partial [bacterium]|nr:hypothetical protein [bacterium]